MDKHDFIILLNRYLEGHATVEERKFIMDYYNTYEDDEDVLDLLNEKSRNDLKAEMKAKIWATIADRDTQHTKIKVLRKWSLSMAVATLFYYFYKFPKR